jgi:hypothetical protein
MNSHQGFKNTKRHSVLDMVSRLEHSFSFQQGVCVQLLVRLRDDNPFHQPLKSNMREKQ